MSARASSLAGRIREGVGWFARDDRALIAVTGEDRERWLNGMLTNDVEALAPGPETSGCPALLLTPKGRIVADLHVLLRHQAFWLELAAEAVPSVLARLERYIIADDVTLEDVTAGHGGFGLAGRRAGELLARVLPGVRALAPGACIDVDLEDTPLCVAALGRSGVGDHQIIAPRSQTAAVLDALREADTSGWLIEGDEAALEVLRVEAGIPRFGRELDEEVLPAEARLDAAISIAKGCYTGQEIVARLRSRGQVNHLLVGLDLSEAPGGLPDLFDGERRIGEVTSRVDSVAGSSIGLGYVRRELSEPGTRLRAGEAAGTAVVASLPFIDSDAVRSSGDA